jgi:hypothetical protein
MLEKLFRGQTSFGSVLLIHRTAPRISVFPERMQGGRSSGGFDGAVLSPYRDPVQQHFARLVRDAIAACSNIES